MLLGSCSGDPPCCLGFQARGGTLRAADVNADLSGQLAERPIEVRSRVCPSHEPDVRYLGTSRTSALASMLEVVTVYVCRFSCRRRELCVRRWWDLDYQVASNIAETDWVKHRPDSDSFSKLVGLTLIDNRRGDRNLSLQGSSWKIAGKREYTVQYVKLLDMHDGIVHVSSI